MIYVRYAGFPRSLRSLGMTYGRFWIYFFRLSFRGATSLRRRNQGEAAFSLRWIPTVTAFPRNDVWKIWALLFRLSLREATSLRRRNQGEAAFRNAGFPRSLRSLGMTYGRFGIYLSVCHCEKQHRCDVGIKAKTHFRDTGFPRSLRSLGMTYGRFWIYFFRLSFRGATSLRRVESDSRITLLLNQPNLGSKFQ